MNKKYHLAYRQLLALAEEKDAYASLANILAYLRFEIADINWAGIYLYKEGELVLGPFSGRFACTHIPVGHGVCGTSFQNRELMNVEDVHSFPGHIACDSASASELVIPFTEHRGVLDIDSPLLSRFSREEEEFFTAAKTVIENKLSLLKG